MFVTSVPSLSEARSRPHPCSPLPPRSPASRLPPRRPSRRRRAAPTSSPARVSTTMNCSKRRYVLGVLFLYPIASLRGFASAVVVVNIIIIIIIIARRPSSASTDDAWMAWMDFPPDPIARRARRRMRLIARENNRGIFTSKQRGIPRSSATSSFAAPPTTGRRVVRGERGRRPDPGFAVGALDSPRTESDSPLWWSMDVVDGSRLEKLTDKLFIPSRVAKHDQAG